MELRDRMSLAYHVGAFSLEGLEHGYVAIYMSCTPGKLAESVESASNQYEQMGFSRGPLRFSLILTLSLFSLITLLLSVLAAIYLSRRIGAPLGGLAEGTRAVATGKSQSRAPCTR